MGGGEAEDVLDILDRFPVHGSLPSRVALRVNANKGKWVSMDHSKSKKHEGVAVYLAVAGNMSKKFRINVFEHFTHQLGIMLIDELVTVCIRS